MPRSNSRRIGARPIGPASGDYVEYPNSTTILAAAKLTGRLPSKTSIAFLAAVTDKETAAIASLGLAGTRAVSVADAPAHIFGYTCANDVTAMELLQRDPSFPQWARAKSFDGFGAFGPVIETDFDVASATLRTLVNGRERQHYALSDMFFGPHELVSRLSFDMTLEPGDLILCGTSLGVLPMKPGSWVEVVVDGIGALRNAYAPPG